jgi:hypothetical protein
MTSSNPAMRDAERKVVHLADYADAVLKVANSITVVGEDHFARLYGRAMFLAVDALLVWAPFVKNNARHRLGRDAVQPVEAALERLRAAYDGGFSEIRDRDTAHQQPMDLGTALANWEHISVSLLTVLRDDVAEVAQLLGELGEVPTWLPTTPSHVRVVVPGATRGPTVFDATRRGGAREDAVTMIPCHPTQEKLMRVANAADGLTWSFTLLRQLPTREVAHKSAWDLVLVDGMSLIDMVFTDMPASHGNTHEPSLVTMWRDHGFGGAEALAALPRDLALEAEIKDARNRTAAHIDRNLSLAEIWSLSLASERQQVASYLQNLWRGVREAARGDGATSWVLAHGASLETPRTRKDARFDDAEN